MEDGSIRPWRTCSQYFPGGTPGVLRRPASGGLYALGTTSSGLLLMDQEGKPLLHLNKTILTRRTTPCCVSMKTFVAESVAGADNGIDYVELGAPFSIIG